MSWEVRETGEIQVCRSTLLVMGATERAHKFEKGKNPMTKKIALNARVSTADQHSGLEAQIRALKEHCERTKCGEYELFTDKNVSGAKLSRPSLDRMIE